MSEPLFLKSVLKERIWGGTKLHDEFGYDLPSDKIGEYWAISAHPNGPSTVQNGQYKGMTLEQLWENHRSIFGDAKGNVFPLLTKILDANDDLSVQVHPDDAYGLKCEGELGKTECWYIMDAEEGAEIVYGHHAKTKEELEAMIREGKWDDLLQRIKVKKGDFFFVPSGTIHAIGAGILILETQQSSDTTYRLYDYDRKDDMGNLRELHIQQSIDVTTVPHVNATEESTVEKLENVEITTYAKTDFFNVYQWDIKGKAAFEAIAPYTLVSVLEGEGSLFVESDHYPLSKGSNFVLPNDIKHWTIDGKLQIIASIPGIKL
jgi:mannose-6-phosphate isomerase